MLMVVVVLPPWIVIGAHCRVKTPAAILVQAVKATVIIFSGSLGAILSLVHFFFFDMYSFHTLFFFLSCPYRYQRYALVRLPGKVCTLLHLAYTFAPICFIVFLTPKVNLSLTTHLHHKSSEHIFITHPRILIPNNTISRVELVDLSKRATSSPWAGSMLQSSPDVLVDFTPRDLIFIDYSVNDGLVFRHNNTDLTQMVLQDGLETLIRQLLLRRRHNFSPAIVLLEQLPFDTNRGGRGENMIDPLHNPLNIPY